MKFFQDFITYLGNICGMNVILRRTSPADSTYHIVALEEIIRDLKEGTGEFKYLSVGVHAGTAVFRELLSEWTAYNERKSSKRNRIANSSSMARIESSKASNSDGKEESIKPMVDALNAYFTTVGVVAALTLTISTPFLIQKTEFSEIVTDVWANNTEHDSTKRSQLNVALVAMMNASHLSSLLAIVTSFSLYINLNMVMIDASDKFWFVRENRVDVCEVFLVLSLFFLGFSIPIGIFVVFGFKTSFISLGMMLVTLSYFLVFIFNMVLQNQARLRPKFKQVGMELEQKWKVLKTTIENAMREEEPGSDHGDFWAVYQNKVNESKQIRFQDEIKSYVAGMIKVDRQDSDEALHQDHDESDCVQSIMMHSQGVNRYRQFKVIHGLC
jgi:hypothetical protein